MKQSKLRRRRVLRFAILYFVIFIIFVALIAAPLVVKKMIPDSITGMLNSTNLIQPTGLDNNDTIGHTQTGTGAANYTGILASETGSASSAATATSKAKKIRLF